MGWVVVSAPTHTVLAADPMSRWGKLRMEERKLMQASNLAW